MLYLAAIPWHGPCNKSDSDSLTPLWIIMSRFKDMPNSQDRRDAKIHTITVRRAVVKKDGRGDLVNCLGVEGLSEPISTIFRKPGFGYKESILIIVVYRSRGIYCTYFHKRDMMSVAHFYCLSNFSFYAFLLCFSPMFCSCNASNVLFSSYQTQCFT